MREIKFRGKCKDTGVWLYGALVDHLWTYSELSKTPGQPVVDIITSGEAQDWAGVEYLAGTVFAESVGQFTGLKDKKGIDIYEQDIVRDEHTVFEIYWLKGRFDFRRISGAFQHPYFGDNCGRMEVIGNVFEHPHLLTP